MPGYMPTQVDIVNSKIVALKVVHDLKLADNPAAKERFDRNRTRTEDDPGLAGRWLARQSEGRAGTR
jgi:succinoglycan biosynthesis transport protein ExoP